jgi:hypothetical protein
MPRMLAKSTTTRHFGSGWTWTADYRWADVIIDRYVALPAFPLVLYESTALYPVIFYFSREMELFGSVALDSTLLLYFVFDETLNQRAISFFDEKKKDYISTATYFENDKKT